MDPFRFSADLVKATAEEDGTYTLEGMASLPGHDLQHEEVDPQGLDIDYFLGKGLPPGAGGYINYDHNAETIVGYPVEGRVGPQGFWVKWRTLDTPFVHRVMDQMQALKKAGWPRRYGMSIEGVVQDRDPHDPAKIRRAFIRNVALTPTPVHPGTFVEFAKSLAADAVVTWDPAAGLAAALRGWVADATAIRGRRVPVDRNPWFRPDGRLRPAQDEAYFTDRWGVDPSQAPRAAHYVARHEAAMLKAWEVGTIRAHLLARRSHGPPDPHLTPDGRFAGGTPTVAAHFRDCEGLAPAVTHHLVRVAHGSPLLARPRKETRDA